MVLNLSVVRQTLYLITFSENRTDVSKQKTSAFRWEVRKNNILNMKQRQSFIIDTRFLQEERNFFFNSISNNWVYHDALIYCVNKLVSKIGIRSDTNCSLWHVFV